MSYLSDFEHTQLEAHVFPGMVVETQYISDTTTGQRRVPQTKIWNVERTLGKGGFGEVRLETHKSEKRAVKRVWATGSTFEVQYERELKALLEFSKPKYKEKAVFVGFLGWFQAPESVYLAMEYVPLGDLEDNVAKIGGNIGEGEVKQIAMQILEGLKIMHLESFVHRDLKPKNVLVCRGSPNWWVKLADFGLSKRRTEDTALRTQTGTQAYMAPEILNYVPGYSEYTYAVDIWALGCIMYRLIAGTVPFPPGLSLTSFCGDESKFPSLPLHMSDGGKDFIRKLIVTDPSTRSTSSEALDHEWIKADRKGQDESLGELITPTTDTLKVPLRSFGEFDTDTHAGLQSYADGSLAPVAVNTISTTPPKPPSIRYQKPTVEDGLESDSEIRSPSNPVGAQVLRHKDSGTLRSMQRQDEGTIYQDANTKSRNIEVATTHNQEYEQEARVPKIFSESLQGDLARTSSGRSPETPILEQPDEAEGKDATEWGFLQRRVQDDEPASFDPADDRESESYVSEVEIRPDRDSMEDSWREPRTAPVRRNEPTRYVVENGRTDPVAKSARRKPRTAPIRRNESTRYIVENGRTVPQRLRARSYRDESGYEALFPELTVDNLRKHNREVGTYTLKNMPDDHSIRTSTRGISGDSRGKSRHQRILSRSSSPEDFDDQALNQPSFYADEHGFVERALSAGGTAESTRHTREALRTARKEMRQFEQSPPSVCESGCEDELEPIVLKPIVLTARPKRYLEQEYPLETSRFGTVYQPEHVIYSRHAAGLQDYDQRPTSRAAELQDSTREGRDKNDENVSRYQPEHVIYSRHAAGLRSPNRRTREPNEGDDEYYYRPPLYT